MARIKDLRTNKYIYISLKCYKIIFLNKDYLAQVDRNNGNVVRVWARCNYRAMINPSPAAYSGVWDASTLVRRGGVY